MESQGPWVSASDLAEYAYCPRSYWYSTHPEAAPGAPSSDSRARRGVRYHQRTLSAERSREEHVGVYLGLLLLGLAVLGVALVVLGVL